jgi:hypothetical protein
LDEESQNMPVLALENSFALLFVYVLQFAAEAGEMQ